MGLSEPRGGIAAFDRLVRQAYDQGPQRSPRRVLDRRQRLRRSRPLQTERIQWLTIAVTGQANPQCSVETGRQWPGPARCSATTPNLAKRPSRGWVKCRLDPAA